MESHSLPLRHRLGQIVSKRSFWRLVAMLAGVTFLHYLTPQTRFFPLTLYPLKRHAVERILFLLPVAGATFAFGQVGGLFTLILAVLIMLPRAFLISPYIADSIAETGAVAIVGYFVIWMIETQEREKQLRQEAVSQLRTINAVSAIVTKSLELEQILNGALDKVLEVTEVEMGFIHLLDRGTQELVLTIHRELSPEFASEIARLKLGESLTGWVGQSGEPKVVDNLLQERQLTTSLASEAGMRSFIAVPLKSRDRVLGVMGLADSKYQRFTFQDVQLLTSIGNEIGVAIENAHLYENMRFYVQQITRAQEDERERIARELHDDTIQSLIVLSRRLEALVTLGEQMPPASAQRLEELGKITDDIIQSVRRFSQALRPSILDDLGLLPTLEGLATNLTEQDGIQAELQVLGEKRRLSPEVELALFRIAQETLNNVKRHAQATRVAITVEFTDDAVQVTVGDDGKGFTSPILAEDLAASGKLGLIGMYERARLLEGTLVIESRPGQGTTVMVNVPA